MTTDAIEAGARAIRELCDNRLKDDDNRIPTASEVAKACIEAAIASGALVPAAQLAAERERCAHLAENFDHKTTWPGCDSGHELSTVTNVTAGETCDDIAAAIRALEPSGDCVLVPRVPTQAMIDEATGSATGAGVPDEDYDDDVRRIYRAMLAAASPNGRAGT